MADRPTLLELIDAVRGHLESQIIPAIKSDPKLYFQTLVAVNVLRVSEREVMLRYVHLGAAWTRLDALTDDSEPMPAHPADVEHAYAARERALCAAIRAGEYESGGRHADQRRALFDHLMASTRDALAIANPKLLETLTGEDS